MMMTGTMTIIKLGRAIGPLMTGILDTGMIGKPRLTMLMSLLPWMKSRMMP